MGGYQLEPRAKQILAGLSFREKDFHRPLREMSGGWVMRAHLARLLVQSPDLLMLDEPTNHLDLESLQWFQEYLRQYPGAILLISHDRAFLNQLTDQIWELRQRKLIRYRGNYDDYLAQRAGRRSPAVGRLQKPAARNRPSDGIRRALPRQGQQGRPGPEQAQAGRAHGKNRSPRQRRPAKSNSTFRSRSAAA